jgi:hypothetical protein
MQNKRIIFTTMLDFLLFMVFHFLMESYYGARKKSIEGTESGDFYLRVMYGGAACCLPTGAAQACVQHTRKQVHRYTADLYTASAAVFPHILTDDDFKADCPIKILIRADV